MILCKIIKSDGSISFVNVDTINEAEALAAVSNWLSPPDVEPKWLAPDFEVVISPIKRSDVPAISVHGDPLN